MPARRRLVLAAAAGVAWLPAASLPRPVGRSAARLRCGAEISLMTSGLARALQRGFGRDTGLAVQLLAAPATALLAALRDGEIDAVFSNAPDAEAELERQGLAHSRHRLALGSFVLVGPVSRTRSTVATPGGAESTAAGGRSDAAVASALQSIAVSARSDPSRVAFLTPNDGSAAHLAEQRLWRAAGVDPAAPWYAAADPRRDFMTDVRERGAWALVEHGAWLATGGGSGRGRAAPIGVAAAVDVPVHAMRSFRSPHPAGRIFIDWIAGGAGRAIAASRPGYRRAG